MPRVEQAFTGDGGDTIVDPKNGNRAVEEYTNLDMYLTTDGAVATLREISPSCLTATDPPALCDPNPRFIAPIEMDVNNPNHWVAGGQYVWNDTKSWNTVCSGDEGCDWKKVYDTGAGHQVTALAAQRQDHVRRVVRRLQPADVRPWAGHELRRDLARAGAGRRAEPLHHLDRRGPGERRARVHQHRLLQPPLDPGRRASGHVFESTDGGASWTDVTGNLPDAPVYKVAIAGDRLVAGTEVGAFVAPGARRLAAGLVPARQGPAEGDRLGRD